MLEGQGSFSASPVPVQGRQDMRQSSRQGVSLTQHPGEDRGTACWPVGRPTVGMSMAAPDLDVFTSMTIIVLCANITRFRSGSPFIPVSASWICPTILGAFLGFLVQDKNLKTKQNHERQKGRCMVVGAESTKDNTRSFRIKEKRL